VLELPGITSNYFYVADGRPDTCGMYGQTNEKLIIGTKVQVICLNSKSVVIRLSITNG
jgi:hypothetical protein